MTSILTIESASMYATGSITDQGLSPVADNIIPLRYVKAGGEDLPTLAAIQTRGSAHDPGTYSPKASVAGKRSGR